MRVPLRSSIAIVSLALAAACGGAEPPVASALPDDVGPIDADPAITVDDSLFDPAELVVAAGTRVTWTWEGRIAHDVVGDGFESSLLTTGTFIHVFDDPGTYAYICTLHPGMTGVVHVVEAER